MIIWSCLKCHSECNRGKLLLKVVVSLTGNISVSQATWGDDSRLKKRLHHFISSNPSLLNITWCDIIITAYPIFAIIHHYRDCSLVLVHWYSYNYFINSMSIHAIHEEEKTMYIYPRDYDFLDLRLYIINDLCWANVTNRHGIGIFLFFFM